MSTLRFINDMTLDDSHEYATTTTTTAAATTTATNTHHLRMLQSRQDRATDGPVAVLIVVCVLFCFIWTPMLFQRRCRIRRRQRAEEQVAETIRMSLRNLNMLGLDESVLGGVTGAHRVRNATYTLGDDPVPGGMRPEDRRSYIQNVLVTKRIVQINHAESSSHHSTKPNDNNDNDNNNSNASDANANNMSSHSDKDYDLIPAKNSGMILADILDPTQTTKHKSIEPCAICLNNYREGDLLCWSHNQRCNHIFHRDCMEEWLVRHDECPCCRNNYLSLSDDEEEGDNHDDDNDNNRGHVIMGSSNLGNNRNNADSMSDTSAFLQGMHLFYLLSRLQNLNDSGGEAPLSVVAGNRTTSPPSSSSPSRRRNDNNEDNNNNSFRHSHRHTGNDDNDDDNDNMDINIELGNVQTGQASVHQSLENGDSSASPSPRMNDDIDGDDGAPPLRPTSTTTNNFNDDDDANDSLPSVRIGSLTESNNPNSPIMRDANNTEDHD